MASSIQITNEATALTTMQLFLEKHYMNELETLLIMQESDLATIPIDMHLLIEFNYELSMLVLESPTKYLPIFDEACKGAQTRLKSQLGLTDREIKDAHVRVTHLPNHPSLVRAHVPGSEDIGRLVSISGTVIRTGVIKMMETHRVYMCTKCRGTFMVEASIEQYNYIPKPARCMAQGEEFCSSTSFRPVTTETGEAMQHCTDYQEIKIQEQVNKLTLGTIPRSIIVILEHDLVDQAKSGDTVTVTGVVIRRWRPLVVGERADIAVAVRANSINVHNDQSSQVTITDEMKAEFRRFWGHHAESPLVGRDLIVSSMCPQVYGLFYVKLAVMLVMVSGVPREDPSGLRVRGEAHLLLVGDPGTAKSQFLKYASKLSPRSVLTTGIGSSSAGLTVTAVKDGPDWQLEAGALVLADRGICCIDEFGSIREAEKSTILEAMEQQSISVAKAGIVCKLNSRCTVLAAMNPKGRYDPEQSLEVNVALSTPLLSRFDLVMILLDTHDREWDEHVSSFLLADESKKAEGSLSGLSFTSLRNRTEDDDPWAFEKLQAYIAYIKSTIMPVTTPASEQVLTMYYRMQRQNDQQNAARTTVRLLESLIRLSQAHARLMFRAKVRVEDAVMAVVLMESTSFSASIFGFTDALHTTFPEDPELFYAELEKRVLHKLALEHLAAG